jgi:hypothetical protein
MAAQLALAASVAAAAGCGNTTGRILETIDAGSPPSATLRIDAFLIRSVSTCAVGTSCASNDPTQCFYIGDSSGPRVSFAVSGLRFVPPSDPSAVTSGNNQVSCFRLMLDNATFAAASNLLNGLRAQVFQASGGDIDLDLHLHDVAALDAGFAIFTTGIFLQPAALATVGLPLINRETDFTFAITGTGDPATGLAPEMVKCEGSNWPAKGVLGASTYSWLAMSSSCASASTFLRTWLNQVSLSRRDITLAPDIYDGAYPACGRGDLDPTRWFPGVDDCVTDPDASTCGRSACPDSAAFYQHILEKHWPRGRGFDGNYCDDGRIDFDETGVDRGGVCDLIGR